MDLKGIEYLRTKLSGKRTRIDRRYSFYEMKHMAEDMRISTPPQLQWMMYSLGWCGKAVDSLADRLVFGRFANDAYNLGGIFQLNNQDVLIDSVVRGALICSCSFVYITGCGRQSADAGHRCQERHRDHRSYHQYAGGRLCDSGG